MNWLSIILLASTFYLIPNTGMGQHYRLPNEEIVYSFRSGKNKKLVIAKDSSDAYLVYRFGTLQKVEMEFPERNHQSWSKFRYSFWLRPGGKMNEGMDINFLQFTLDSVKYVVYDCYYEADNTPYVGIKIINLRTGREKKIEGKVKTRKGSLIDFRYNDQIEKSDELFE